MTASPALSVLDLVPVRSGQTSAAAVAASARLARLADRLGYRRYWFAEHHNMPAVASTTPPVLAAAIAAQTERIRVGSGGVMLPNHAPLVVAEQFAALEAIAPRREVVSYRQAKAAVRLAEARSCYDHLAGRVAIGLADALAAEGAVEALEAGAPGRLGRVDGELGRRFRLDELRAEGRRAIVRGCLDWTERRPHIAGRLGAHLLEVALDEGWVERMPEGRGLVVTASGRAVLPA